MKKGKKAPPAAGGNDSPQTPSSGVCIDGLTLDTGCVKAAQRERSNFRENCEREGVCARTAHRPTYIKVWCPDGPCPDAGLTPDDVSALWRLSRDEGLLAVIGRDVDALRLGQFVRLVSRSDVFFAVYGTDGEPLGYVYLTHKEGRSARIHFAIFKAGRPDALSLGRMALDFLFGLGCWDSLVGVIPAPFRAAIRFARDLGGGDRGEIPGMCWMARQNRAVAGRQFIFTREVYGYGRQQTGQQRCDTGAGRSTAGADGSAETDGRAPAQV